MAPVDELTETLIGEIKPVLTQMGFELVELKLGHSRHQQHVSVVIYRSSGVGIQDCAAVAKNVKPRLDMIPGLEELTLQVSSPGLERVIKDPEEYRIFQGRGVRVRLDEASGWQGGVIQGVNENSLLLKQAQGVLEIMFDQIKKAKLDYKQEVEG